MATASVSSSVVSVKTASALQEGCSACRRARVRAAMGCAAFGWEHSRVCTGTVYHGVSVGVGLGVVSFVSGSVGTLGGSACTLGGVVLWVGAVVA
jgi:hypothetical protein